MVHDGPQPWAAAKILWRALCAALRVSKTQRGGMRMERGWRWLSPIASMAEAEAETSWRQRTKPVACETRCGSDWDTERRNLGRDEL
jgi:hypothetical protein